MNLTKTNTVSLTRLEAITITAGKIVKPIATEPIYIGAPVIKAFFES